jgi:hypothetical protein
MGATFAEGEGGEALCEGLRLVGCLFKVPDDVLGFEPDCVLGFVEQELCVESGKAVEAPQQRIHR